MGIFVEGGRKGVIWIPEGKNGRGWRRFAGEMQLLISSKVKGLDLEASQVPSSAGLFTGRSFVEVIREVPCVEVRISQKSLPLCLLNVLPFSGDCLGKGCSGSEMRMAVDCYELGVVSGYCVFVEEEEGSVSAEEEEEGWLIGGGHCRAEKEEDEGLFGQLVV